MQSQTSSRTALDSPASHNRAIFLHLPQSPQGWPRRPGVPSQGWLRQRESGQGLSPSPAIIPFSSASLLFSSQEAHLIDRTTEGQRG